MSLCPWAETSQEFIRPFFLSGGAGRLWEPELCGFLPQTGYGSGTAFSFGAELCHNITWAYFKTVTVPLSLPET